MPRSERSTAAEARRHRSALRYSGRDGELVSGHPAMFALTPVVELGRQPEGGGFPVGLVEWAFDVMDVTAPERVLHVCSGSVRARLTLDLRSGGWSLNPGRRPVVPFPSVLAALDPD